MYPKIKREIILATMDHQKACCVSITKYGKRGISPEILYDTNIIAEAIIEVLFFPTILEDSSVAVSDKKLPTDIEKASTQINTIPEISISLRATPAEAIPANNPTVETKLSSEPKMKFLVYKIKVFFTIPYSVYHSISVQSLLRAFLCQLSFQNSVLFIVLYKTER